MSRLIFNNLGFLHHLANYLPYQKRLLLATASPEQVHAICEVCMNLSRGTIPISDTQIQSLRKHRDNIRVLSNPMVPFKAKKQVLAQTGECFVSDVVSPLVSALGLLMI